MKTISEHKKSIAFLRKLEDQFLKQINPENFTYYYNRIRSIRQLIDIKLAKLKEYCY